MATVTLRKTVSGDDRLLIQGLRTVNLSTGVETYLDGSATVEATVLDRDTEEEIVGDTWPLALTYITGSEGDFHGPLRDSLVIVPHQWLVVVLVIDNGDDQRRTLRLRCQARTDTGDS